MRGMEPSHVITFDLVFSKIKLKDSSYMFVCKYVYICIYIYEEPQEILFYFKF